MCTKEGSIDSSCPGEHVGRKRPYLALIASYHLFIRDAPHSHFPLLMFGLRLRAICICNQLLAVGVPIASAVCVFEYVVPDSEWYY